MNEHVRKRRRAFVDEKMGIDRCRINGAGVICTKDHIYTQPAALPANIKRSHEVLYGEVQLWYRRQEGSWSDEEVFEASNTDTRFFAVKKMDKVSGQFLSSK